MRRVVLAVHSLVVMMIIMVIVPLIGAASHHPQHRYAPGGDEPIEQTGR